MPDRDPPEDDRAGRFRRLGRRLFGEPEADDRREDRRDDHEDREEPRREDHRREDHRREDRGREEHRREDRGRSIRLDAREVLGAIWEGGDRAKTEVVRAVAREVRNYIEELGLKEDLRSLMTNYSLEVRASIHLRKLAPEEKGADRAAERGAERGAERAE